MVWVLAGLNTSTKVPHLVRDTRSLQALLTLDHCKVHKPLGLQSPTISRGTVADLGCGNLRNLTSGSTACESSAQRAFQTGNFSFAHLLFTPAPTTTQLTETACIDFNGTQLLDSATPRAAAGTSFGAPPTIPRSWKPWMKLRGTCKSAQVLL